MIGALNLYYNTGFTNATWDMGGANPLTISYDIPPFYKQDPHRAATSGGCKDTDAYLQRAIDAAPRDQFDYLLIIGARQPIIMSSRAESADAKINSIALAVLMAER